MKFKTFLILSVIVHAILFAGIYFLPAPEPDNEQKFVTTLVFPEEVNKPEKIPPPAPGPPVKLRPAPPVVMKRAKKPSKEKPVVPGKGSETGKPLPERMKPETGRPSAGEERTADAGGTEPGYANRNRIFDKDVISSIAKKDSQGNSEGDHRDKTITFNTEQYRYAGYMSKLRERIESIWKYPIEARKKGIYGDLKIRFTIKKNGRLEGVELVRTSGYKMLDEAALEALKDGEPYWPLPEEWGMESYTILGHFIYSMYGYYVR